MENKKESYDKLYYPLLAVSLSGLIIGGIYFSYAYFNTNDIKPSNKEKETEDMNELFEKILNDLYENIRNDVNNEYYSKDVLANIIGLIKEYADYLYEKSNKENIKNRRKLLFKIINTKIKEDKSILSHNNLINNKIEDYQLLTLKYEELCNIEYTNNYSFALSNARRYVLKRLKFKKRKFIQSMQKIQITDLFYYKINYYNNIFNNCDNTNNLNISLIKKLFLNYSYKLINQIAKIETNLTDKDNECPNIQLIKLRISDELYLAYNIDDKMLKYLAITKHRLDKDEEYKILLEKINGVEIMSIGL
jgi:hypothetical protein